MYAYIVGAEGDSAENRAQNRALSRAQSLFIPTLTNANILDLQKSGSFESEFKDEAAIDVYGYDCIQ